MIDRILYVGSTSSASTIFSDIDGNILPSADPNKYPCYTITDTNNDIVTRGVSSLFNGNYIADFTIPTDAILSLPNKKWCITWDFVDVVGKSYSYKEFFDVVSEHKDFDISEQQKLVIVSNPIDVMLPLVVCPSSIQVSIDSMEKTIVGPIPPELISQYNDMYYYSATVDSNTLEAYADYAVVWKFEINGNSSSYVTRLYTIDLFGMLLISDLRMFLDKTLKDVSIHLGYHDSELMFGILHGLEHMNGMFYHTDWSIDFIKNNLRFRTPLLLASVWWVLSFQFLAETDSLFDYSGQQVSLTIDRTSQLSEMKNDCKSYLDEDFKAMKKQYIKSQRGVHLGTSGYPRVGGGPRYGVHRKAGQMISSITREPWLQNRIF
jgi:hypothetical protein